MAQRASPQWFDAMYNPRAQVADSAERIAAWARQSAPVREAQEARLDLPYGSGEAEALDVFVAASASASTSASGGAGRAALAPVLVFLHGGFWRALGKSDHAFIAPSFTRSGVCVVIPDYSLCPGSAGRPVTVASITLQMVRALAWVWRNIWRHGGDSARITVAGHSAGGQLAAMMLACDWPAVAPDLPLALVRSALSISGLHELEPIRRTPYLQPSLRLSAQDVRRASPARLRAPPHAVLHCVCGGNESAEFLRQTRLIRQRWGRSVVPVCQTLPGLNHFSILDAFATPDSPLHRQTLALLQA